MEGRHWISGIISAFDVPYVYCSMDVPTSWLQYVACSTIKYVKLSLLDDNNNISFVVKKYIAVTHHFKKEKINYSYVC